MPLLPVGTEVRLSDFGRQTYTNSLSNPHDEEGLISDHNSYSESYVYEVTWDSGRENDYRMDDLEALDETKNSGKLKGVAVWLKKLEETV